MQTTQHSLATEVNKGGPGWLGETTKQTPGVRLFDAALQAQLYRSRTLCARASCWKHPRRSCCGSGGECDWAAAMAVAVARRERWEEEAREDDGAAMLTLLGWRWWQRALPQRLAVFVSLR